MKGWIIMEKYIGTIIVAAIIIIVCVLAIRSMIKIKSPENLFSAEETVTIVTDVISFILLSFEPYSGL